MKRKPIRVLALLLCALMLLALCACKHTETPPTDDPGSENPDDPSVPVGPGTPDVPSEGPQPVTCTDQTLEKTLSDDQNNELISLKLTVPMPEGLTAAQQYYTDWLNDTEYYCSLEQEDAAALRDTMLQMGGIFVPYTYEASYELLRNDGVLLSVYRDYYTNTGGVHPNISTMAETFVVDSGARLVLDDVFTVPADQYLSRLKELILPMMDAKEQQFGDTLYMDGVRDTLMEIYDPQNFALTDDSLLVFFPTYALASYAAGIQEFYIPLSDLSDILNSSWTAQ
ncbi:MAG: DUF3298 and DUF4163 domain-containing protein [Clostridiaceae bacterium]|nr:DUF3298 and DUF4163 domain-containing protein [Clostridiaceae bacterium]